MTTTLVAPHTWRSYDAAPETSLIAIEGMPASARAGVEKLMCALPEAAVAPQEANIWDMHWCTQWKRGFDGTYSCSELVAATAEELSAFKRAITRLADTHGFSVSINALQR